MWLVEGLDTGNADRDQDGYVGLDELYDYVYEHVQRSTPNQTPGKWTFDLRGELRVARRARPVTVPAPLPQELHAAINHPLSGMRAGAVGELERLLHGGHAGLALAARIELERLAQDDSRMVGSAAATALGLPTNPISPPRTEPVESDPVAPPNTAEPARHAESTESEAVVATPPPETTTSRLTVGLSVTGRVLATAAAFGLAYQYSGLHRFVTDSSVFSRVGFVVVVLLWPLAGCVLVVAVAGRHRRERDQARPLALGLASGLLAALSVSLDVIGSIEPEFRVTVVVALVALLAVMIDLVPGHAVVETVINVVSVAAALAALAPLVLMSFDDLQPFSWRTVLCVAVLIAANVTVWIRRWLRAPRTRMALVLGAISTALVLFDALSANSSHANAFSLVFFPALPIALVINVLVDDRRAVPLAAARLSLIFGLLVLDAPIYSNTPPGLIPVSVHPIVEIAAAICALAAYYAAVDRRRRPAR